MRKHSYYWDHNPPGALEFCCEEEVLLWRLTDAEHLEEYLSMGAFSKMFGKSVVKAGDPAASDSDFETRWPNLALLMQATTDDQGKPRQTATLTFVCEQGKWKGGVKDKDHAMSLWRSADAMAGVLDALERALDDGTADWKVQETRSRK